MENMDSLAEALGPYNRRYGEPDWTNRPQVQIFPPEQGEEVALSCSAESFEEWLLALKNSLEEQSGREEWPESEHARSVRWGNSLAMLCDSAVMVDVVIDDGNRTNTWHLHEKLVCSVSDFFKVAMSSSFQEAKEKKVKLQGESNSVFTLFVQWIYSGDFSTQNMDLLLRAYALGDRLQADKFTSRVIEKAHEKTRWDNFTPEQAVWVAENTMPNSAMRSLVVDTIALSVFCGRMYSPEAWEQLDMLHIEVLQRMSELSQLNHNGELQIPLSLATYLQSTSPFQLLAP